MTAPLERRLRAAALPSLLLALPGLFAACGSDAGDADDSDATLVDGGDTSDADDAASDVADVDPGPQLTPCEDNVDCAGGEVCRVGFCREACDEATPCEGELTVCDVSVSYCVECLETSDCGAGSVCRDQRCRTAECTSPADCRGGQTCREGVCESIDEQICTPGSTACDGNDLLACSRDGTRETRSACDGVCVAESGSAQCRAIVCEPDAIGCLDAQTAWTCDPLGVDRVPLACPSSRTCEEGVCVARLCEPDAVVCEGNFISECNGNGTAFERTDCAACGEDLGCSCVEGACEPRVCRPGAARCVGNASQPCQDDGLGWEAPVGCDADQCVAGRCVDATCIPGTRECAGDTLLECQGDGVSRIEVDCSAAGNICLQDGDALDGGRCVAPLCSPGEPRCFDDVTVAVCDARGASEDLTECDDGRVCVDGACADSFCDPDGPPICDGNSRFACNAAGSAYERIEDCGETSFCTPEACISAACASATVQCVNESTGRDLVAPFRVPAGQRVACTVVGHVTDGTVRWAATSTPSAPLPLRDRTTRAVKFRPVEIGAHRLQATLSDPDSNVCNTLEIELQATPGDNDLTLILGWEPSDGNPVYPDLDLHLRHPNGCWQASPWHCYYGNKTPVWAEADSGYGNPSLDFDVLNGPGPELIYFARPTPLSYQVGVELYTNAVGDGTSGRSADAEVYVIWAGRLQETYSFEVNGSGRFWVGPRIEVTAAGAVRLVGDGEVVNAAPTSCP